MDEKISRTGLVKYLQIMGKHKGVILDAELDLVDPVTLQINLICDCEKILKLYRPPNDEEITKRVFCTVGVKREYLDLVNDYLSLVSLKRPLFTRFLVNNEL